MALGWLALVAAVLTTCLATYGYFLGAPEARQVPRTSGEGCALSAELDRELLGATEVPVEEAQPLVPLAANAEPDVLALRRLRDQELELAALCESRGLTGEALIRTGVAATITRRLAELEGLGSAFEVA